MRKQCLDQVFELAKQDERVVFIGSDLGAGTLAGFKAELPSRFFMEGISEALVVGMAAGMALEGFIPYVNTIGTFISRRCFEQVAVDVCLHNLKVRLIGAGGGLVYAPLGPTHLAVEDISIFRALPNMTIVAVADETEMDRLMPQTLDYPGPLYIRLGKGDEPVVTDGQLGFRIGRAVPMRAGSDALIVTTGVTLQASLSTAEVLAAEGVSCGVLHMHTVKPLDTETLLHLANDVKAVLTVEENTIMGGLGGAVAEALAEAGFSPGKKFGRVGIPDVFPDHYGSQANLLDYYGINAAGITSAVRRLLAA